MGLAEARLAGRAALAALTEGHDPTAQRKAARAARVEAEAVASNTFAAVAERYTRQYVATLRAARSTERVIRSKLIPAFGNRPINEIHRRDVIAMVECTRAANGPEAARRALQTLSSLYSWAQVRDITENNPASRLHKILPPPVARDRVLRDQELRLIWEAIGTLDTPWREFYRVLLLTGQRRSEIAEMRWEEVDFDTAVLTIPATRMKNKKAHVVPLVPSVIAILEALPRFTGGDFVFTTSGGRGPIKDISGAKEQLDAALGSTVAPWRGHDLRRTMRTALSSLGVAVFYAELLLAHTQRGVHAVYDLHRYDDEKRGALVKWEDRLMSIVAPPPVEPPADEKIVPLRARG